MPTKLSPQEFVAKWRNVTLKERSTAQEHFINLCQLVGHKTPAEADPTGESYRIHALIITLLVVFLTRCAGHGV